MPKDKTRAAVRLICFVLQSGTVRPVQDIEMDTFMQTTFNTRVH